MAYDFPGSPTNGQTVIGAGGVVYIWDGVKWAVVMQTLDALPDAPSDGNTYGRRNASWFAALPIVGGTLTGALILSGNAVAALGAVTLQQMQVADSARLPYTGGTLSGPLILAGNATQPLGAVTLQQMQGAISGITGVASFNTRTGAVVLNTQDLVSASGVVYDAKGNVGISITPPAGAASGTQSGIGGWVFGWGVTNTTWATNLYYDGSSFRLLNVGTAWLTQCGPNNITWMYAPSAAADVVPALVTRMTLDRIGNLGLGVTPPANTGNAIFTTSHVAAPNYTFNLYYDGTNWRYLTAGAGAILSPSAGGGATTIYGVATGAVGAVASLAAIATFSLTQGLNVTKSIMASGAAAATPFVGAWAGSSNVGFWNNSNNLCFGNADGNGVIGTQRGYIDTNGNMQLNAQLFAAQGVRPSSFNSYEWSFTTDSSGNHVQNHRANWYDLWQSSNGTRVWASPSGNAMVLDGSGNLTAAASVLAYNTAFGLSADTNNRYFSWASGWYDYWVIASGLRAWASAITGNAVMTLDGRGNLGIQGGFACANMTASGTAQGAYVYSTGIVHADGDLQAGGNMSCQGVYASAGLFQIAPNYYLQRSPSDTNWRFVENGTENFRVQPDGNCYARMNFYGNAAGFVHSVYFANNANFYMGEGAAGYVQQYTSGWYWTFNTSNGNLNWQVPVGNGNLWMMDIVNSRVYCGMGTVGGYGPYQDYSSDERTKTDIRDLDVGLPEVLRLRPIRFGRAGKPDHSEIGFGACQVREVIPEAAGQGIEDDMLSLVTAPIIAALVNGMQELAARVAALEGR
jgi:hypothetical protein